MSSILLVAGIVLLPIAAFATVYGRRQHRKSTLIKDTETTDVRDIKEEGLVELKGTVREDDTFDSPIKGEQSVLSAWEVEEWNETGDSEMWETRAEGIYATPFGLDDETGYVRVEVGTHVKDASTGTGIDEIQIGPINFDRYLSNGVSVDNLLASLSSFSVETTVRPDTEPPERIKNFVQGESGVTTQTDSITNIIDFGNAHGERRYYEGTLGPGDDIYLLGQVRASETATHPLKPDDVVITPPEDGQFIISDKPESELADSFSTYKYAYAGALIAAVSGIAALAIGAGVV
ncbi:hypothetical protein AUR64_14490 [Haloprofundus marisrubri]|uniref:RING-type E3 ubiquitin transferase n=1 Tax=Haloprofundus marisrubri TaxID=1514971 RepID=A0A0W1R719_9EURY|nr:GIDE domain-containing protein [Haloprofundus marisrubri]KTG09008.1 hypothetical protein AUR64_14490 [Haloprofundus marisrubri]